jgi:hypothetical protein
VRRRFLSGILKFFPFLVLLAAGCATAPRPAPVASGRPAWVEIGPQGALARTIVTTGGTVCPEMVVDGAPKAMTARSTPQSCFQVLICEAPIPEGASAVSIGGTKLPVPPKKIKRIAIIGDTGCRLKDENCSDTHTCDPQCTATEIQKCNDPEEWPFASVAALVAREKPDLVVHVGDYHYREARCPEGNPDCQGSPTGDNWPSWKADFFDPAAPLLAAAPWVVARGNHEECKRAGQGWFRFLDPGPVPADCNDDPNPYAAAVPGLQLLVMNTSTAGSEDAAFYAPAFQTVNQLAHDAASPSWLVMHHPLWAFLEYQGKLETLSDNLQQASNNDLDEKIQLVSTGHIHLFEAVGFGKDSGRVPNVITGTTGTELDGPIQKEMVGQSIAGEEVKTAISRDKFGYALAEPDKDGWRLTVYSVKGNPKAVCEIEGTELKCREMTLE